MKKKKTTIALGPILYSRQGTEEGILVQGNGGEVIAWFYEDHNNVVSGETLMRWAKQAQAYEKVLKLLDKKPAVKATAPVEKKKAVQSEKKKKKKKV